MRANLFAALIGLLCVAGCGGGGSGSGLSGGGGGGGGGGGSAGNVQPIIVDTGPSVVANSTSPAINTAYTSVTICAPGSTSVCQTIDHIQVDTGSAGLRILSEALTISLPVQKDTSGNVIAECVPFVDGSSWGPVRQADVKIAGETALNQEVQIIGDTSYSVPSTCTGTTNGSSGGLEDTVAKFGANGILGVAPYVADCGGSCTVQSTTNTYYTCATASTCAQNPVLENLQVSNPVAAFTTDNNGLIIQLPTVPASGSASVTGSLIFGVGTQSNNGLGSATVFNLDSQGFLQTNYKLATLKYAFIDSGSNGIYFHDTSIPQCMVKNSDNTTSSNGFYCPTGGDLSLQANIVNPANNASKSVNFTVTNEQTLFQNATAAIGASSALAGDSHSFGDGTNNTINGDQAFDWGLPFHYGKSVFVVIEGKTTGSGTGPFFAF